MKTKQPPLNLYFPGIWVRPQQAGIVHIQVPWGREIQELKEYIKFIEERAKK